MIAGATMNRSGPGVAAARADPVRVHCSGRSACPGTCWGSCARLAPAGRVARRVSIPKAGQGLSEASGGGEDRCGMCEWSPSAVAAVLLTQSGEAGGEPGPDQAGQMWCTRIHPRAYTHAPLAPPRSTPNSTDLNRRHAKTASSTPQTWQTASQGRCTVPCAPCPCSRRRWRMRRPRCAAWKRFTRCCSPPHTPATASPRPSPRCPTRTACWYERVVRAAWP